MLLPDYPVVSLSGRMRVYLRSYIICREMIEQKLTNQAFELYLRTKSICVRMLMIRIRTYNRAATIAQVMIGYVL